jgi:hypothetical protein
MVFLKLFTLFHRVISVTTRVTLSNLVTLITSRLMTMIIIIIIIIVVVVVVVVIQGTHLEGL